jgi:hypothetical protein
MSGLEVKVDTAEVGKLAERFGSIPKKIRPAIRMAVNDTGNQTRTPMKRALVGQTGLKPKVINAAVRTTPATDASLAYTMTTRGGDIRLKYFAAREYRGGVSAAPRNVRRRYPGRFMKGGRHPNRVAIPALNGHVFARSGRARLPISVQRSGVFIPKEMVIGATAAAFDATSGRVLPARLAHHLGRAVGSR